MRTADLLELVTDRRAEAMARWERESGGGSLCRIDLPPAERARLKRAEGAAYALGDLARALRRGEDAPERIVDGMVASWSARNPQGRGAAFDAYREGGLQALDAVVTTMAAEGSSALAPGRQG